MRPEKGSKAASPTRRLRGGIDGALACELPELARQFRRRIFSPSSSVDCEKPGSLI